HSLAFPRIYRDAFGSDVGCSMILCGENIAGGPAYFCTQLNQGFDQHGSLNGHVNATNNFGASQRLFVFVTLAQRHQCRHLGLGQNDFFASEVSQADIRNFIVGLAHKNSSINKLCVSANADVYRPAASRSAAALSVCSQVNCGSWRPKWP